MILVRILDLKFLSELAATMIGTSNPPHQTQDYRHGSSERQTCCRRLVACTGRGRWPTPSAAIGRCCGANLTTRRRSTILAVIGCQQGRFGEGIELARRSLASEPHQPRAHNLLGMALSRLGRHEEALVSFDHAIVHQPDLADAHGNRASALLELGRTVEAVSSYERAVALQPASIGDWLNLGTALHRLGRHDDALSSYDRALALRAELPRGPLQPRQRARSARALRGGAGEL